MNVQAHRVKDTAAPLLGRPFQQAIAASAPTPEARTRLAVVLRVDPVTVWRWAGGYSEPRSKAMREAIADALGRQSHDLFPPATPPAAAA